MAAIRKDWDGLIDAPRWFHLEYGLVLYGSLERWETNRGRIRLWVQIPDGNKLLCIRAEGVRMLTIGDADD